MKFNDMLHDSSISKVDILFVLAIRMNAADAVLIFSTVPDPLGSAFAHRLVVIVVLLSAPRTPALLTDTHLLLFVVIHRDNLGSGVLRKLVGTGRIGQVKY